MENNPTPPPAPSGPPDAPDKEKMDQIRRRRLEKLGGSTPARIASPSDVSEQSSSTSTLAAPAESSEPAKPKINIRSSTTQQQAAANPFTRLGTASSTGLPSSSIRITPGDSAVKRARLDSDSATPPRKTAANEETLEEFESRILGSVFRVTVDESIQQDASGHKLVFLPNLVEDLQSSGDPLRLTVGSLDSAILEAASKIAHDKAVLDYLLPCWKRIIKALKSLRGSSNGRDVILKEARRLCMSNCIFAITVPELFGREANPFTDSLVPYLLKDTEDDRGIDHEFLKEATSRFDEDNTVAPMLVKSLVGLSSQLAGLTMNDDYKPYVHALKSFTRFSTLVNAIAVEPLFQMAFSAPAIERNTILGPFFRISPLQSEVTKTYFAGPKTMDKGHVKNSQDALRLTLKAHQKDLVDIINAFIRASEASRKRTLDWFAYIVNSNHKRRAMRPDDKTLSSDGFMMNVTVILDELCEPFMDATFSKVSRIDVNYLRRKPRVEIKDETKLNVDQNQSEKFYAVQLEGDSNFISEVFFLNLAAHHYGSEATNSKLKSLDKDIKYFTNTLAQMETERAKFAYNPVQMMQFESALKKYNDVLEKAMSLKFAIEGVLFDDLLQARSLQFMRYAIVFLLRIATGSEYVPGKTTIELPLPEKQPEAFVNLPEYILDDIVSNFNFVFRFVPQAIISAQADELVALCITFLRSSEYIRNPHLKKDLVSLLFAGTFPVYLRQRGILGDALVGDKFANDNLLHALMKFYIEAESTGTHGQFYEKFNIRYEIFQVIKCIWTNDIYKIRLTQESKVNTDFFVRFVNLLLNDATFLLDESLSKFPKIHELQEALKNPAALTEEEKKAKEDELSTAEDQARSYMQLGNETVATMKLFTNTLSGAFTMPEIVLRLAAMLDYNLETLAGPKSRDLKVADPAKYFFNPKTLLAEFVDVYLNLGGQPRFIEAVAKDGRSYKASTFDNASRILERFHLKSTEEMAAWESLKEKFKKAKELDDQAEEDLGEIPDEYLDPLMFSLMEDPVILPMSRQTVDRSTIRGHLLSDQTDPFNRQPMRIEDVVPNTELKEQISVWKEERKAIAKQAIQDRMDTTKG